MSVNVPQPTIEKPLTPIDYIAAMDACISPREISHFSERCPASVRNDERFARAVVAKLQAFKEKRKRA